MFQLIITSRDYTQYQLKPVSSDSSVPNIPSDWIPRTFYHNDILTNELILHSRTLPKQIVGILEYESTYLFPPTKKGIPVYRFTPLLPNYPYLFVSSVNARKYHYKNILVSVGIQEDQPWTPYPHATLHCEIGLATDPICFQKALCIQHQLPSAWNKQWIRVISSASVSVSSISLSTTHRPYYQPIYTIDPVGCRDVDDGISIWEEENGSYCLDIHISDVYSLTKSIGIIPDDILHRSHCSSVYLPTGVIPMLPPFLSEGWGSLLEGQTRGMLSCCIHVDPLGTVDWKIEPIKGIITKNLSYDSEHARQIFTLWGDRIRNVAERLLPTTSGLPPFSDTHDLIAWLMILYNYLFCLHLKRQGIPWIARKTDPETQCGFYEWEPTESYHRHLQLPYYIHASSPLRRWVDWKHQELFYQGGPRTDFGRLNESLAILKKIQDECRTFAFATMVSRDYPLGWKTTVRLIRANLRTPEEPTNILVWTTMDHTNNPIVFSTIGSDETNMVDVGKPVSALLFGHPDPLHVRSSVYIRVEISI